MDIFVTVAIVVSAILIYAELINIFEEIFRRNQSRKKMLYLVNEYLQKDSQKNEKVDYYRFTNILDFIDISDIEPNKEIEDILALYRRLSEGQKRS